MPVSPPFPTSAVPTTLRVLLLSSNPGSAAAQAAIASLAGPKNRAAIVTTASREFKEKNRNALLARETLVQTGFHSVEFFDFDTTPARELDAFDFVYLSGGNPHYLLKRLRETGGDQVVSDLVNAGRPVVGSSAGALVLGHSTAVVEAFDSTLETHGFSFRSALALFPFSLLPHANRWKETAPNYDALLAAVRNESAVPVLELNDHEALLLRDGETRKIIL